MAKALDPDGWIWDEHAPLTVKMPLALHQRIQLMRDATIRQGFDKYEIVAAAVLHLSLDPDEIVAAVRRVKQAEVRDVIPVPDGETVVELQRRGRGRPPA